MKKVFNFLRENPLFVIVALASVVLYVLDNAEAGMSLAAVSVLPAGTPKASKGIAGLDTHAAGEATTVSNASELGGDLTTRSLALQVTRVSLIPSNARFAVRCV